MNTTNYYDRIYIDSKYRSNGDTTDFTIQFQNLFQGNNFYVSEVQFSNTLNNVDTGDVLKITTSGTPDVVTNVTLTAGFYEPADLASALQTAIRAQTTFSSATVAYSTATGKFTLDCDPSATTSYQINKSAIASLIGFVNDTAMNATAKVSEKIPDCYKHKYVYLCSSDIANSSLTTNGISGIIYKIPVRVAYREMDFIVPPTKNLIQMPNAPKQALSFQLRNSDFSVIPSDQVIDYNFTLTIE